jgi:hypothetical protein
VSAASALRRFRSLTRAERRIALEAFLWGGPVEASIRLIGLRRTQAWVARVVPMIRRDEAATRSPAELEKLVGSALGWSPLRGACLQLALVQTLIERRRGHDVQMAIGVKRAPTGEFEAHAWVEDVGAPDETGSFQRIWSWRP